MKGDLTARTIEISGSNGDPLEAYSARPGDNGARGGVVVIHHLPGYDTGTKEITRRFAALGYDAVCPNLYSREAPGAEPDDAAALVRAAGGIPDSRLVGDVAGAAEYLRALTTSNGKVAVIGFCSGGRQAVLAACRLDLDAAVDCYGAYVTGTPAPDFPIAVTPLYNELDQLSCPLIGMFGNDDKTPSPAHVDELDRLLTGYGKEHEFHRYDDAGHAFFAVDRPAYRQAAATDGWRRIDAAFARLIGR